MEKRAKKEAGGRQEEARPESRVLCSTASSTGHTAPAQLSFLLGTTWGLLPPQDLDGMTGPGASTDCPLLTPVGGPIHGYTCSAQLSFLPVTSWRLLPPKHLESTAGPGPLTVNLFPILAGGPMHGCTCSLP